MNGFKFCTFSLSFRSNQNLLTSHQKKISVYSISQKPLSKYLKLYLIEFTKVWAIPFPIVPAPITTMFFILLYSIFNIQNSKFYFCEFTLSFRRNLNLIIFKNYIKNSKSTTRTHFYNGISFTNMIEDFFFIRF